MKAEVKAGKNWQVISNNQGNSFLAEGCIVSINQKLSIENKGLGACVQVKVTDLKVQIPAPFGVKPEDAAGEGVTVSQLKDEEGGAPQEFLNLSQEGSWLAFFESNENDSLKITVK